MPVRSLTAQQVGPLVIDVQLLGVGGVVIVRTDAKCTKAEATISTADKTGISAEAVRDANLRWDARGALVAHVHAKGGSSSGTTITNSGSGTVIARNHCGVVEQVTHHHSSTTVMSGGDLVFGGSRFQFRGGTVTAIQGPSPVQIHAVVPEGCSVTARTQAGDIEVENSPDIIVETQSGDLRLGRTDLVQARTMFGDITISDFGGTAQLKSMFGGIRVHATAGGDITARTMSGDVDVTATEKAVTDGLDVRAASMSGTVHIPQCRPGGTGNGLRRRTS
ncbi:DUF4097 family beta strand repeat-containing protein [Streptomyces xantholiticus]